MVGFPTAPHPAIIRQQVGRPRPHSITTPNPQIPVKKPKKPKKNTK
jgi:hypothetical protein